jgi:hypothetical protein
MCPHVPSAAMCLLSGEGTYIKYQELMSNNNN